METFNWDMSTVDDCVRVFRFPSTFCAPLTQHLVTTFYPSGCICTTIDPHLIPSTIRQKVFQALADMASKEHNKQHIPEWEVQATNSKVGIILDGDEVIRLWDDGSGNIKYFKPNLPPHILKLFGEKLIELANAKPSMII